MSCWHHIDHKLKVLATCSIYVASNISYPDAIRCPSFKVFSARETKVSGVASSNRWYQLGATYGTPKTSISCRRNTFIQENSLNHIWNNMKPAPLGNHDWFNFARILDSNLALRSITHSAFRIYDWWCMDKKGLTSPAAQKRRCDVKQQIATNTQDLIWTWYLLFQVFVCTMENLASIRWDDANHLHTAILRNDKQLDTLMHFARLEE